MQFGTNLPTGELPPETWPKNKTLKEEWSSGNIAGFVVHTCSSNIRFHTIGRPSGCLALHHPLPQSATEYWLKELYSNPLIIRPELPGSRTIWRFRTPLGAVDWVFVSYALRMKPEMLVVQCCLPPQIPGSILSNALYTVGVQLKSVLSLSVDWLLVVSVGHSSSSSHLRHEKTMCRTTSAEDIWYTLRDAFQANSLETPTCDPTKTFEGFHLGASGVYVATLNRKTKWDTLMIRDGIYWRALQSIHRVLYTYRSQQNPICSSLSQPVLMNSNTLFSWRRRFHKNGGTEANFRRSWTGRLVFVCQSRTDG